MENWLVVVLAVAAVLTVALVIWQVSRRKRPTLESRPQPPVEIAQEKPVSTLEKMAPAPAPVEPPVAEPAPLKLADKLSRTRGALFGRLSKWVGGSGATQLEAKEWEELEEVLLEADVGVSTAFKLLDKVKAGLKESQGASIRDLVRKECKALLVNGPTGFPSITEHNQPYVISIVGINGVGKTTTTGKLAYLLKQEGKSVLLAAADTFRAAAIAQLKVWSERADVQFVTGREGADPGAVAFDALTAAKARAVDVVLVDTAGRLHTKTSLMDELKKVHRVMKKVITDAPHETWLVLDGTLGQNSILQAKEFQKTLELTGVIITKLDGTAKGGAILAVASELNLPVRFIGVGESIEDFLPFDPDGFIDAILGEAHESARVAV